MGLKEKVNLLDENEWNFSDNFQETRTETIQEVIEKAANIIPLVYPMANFIATNPLRDLETLRFDQAYNYAATYYDSTRPIDPVTRKLNTELIKWCQTYLDRGQASIGMPNKGQGFYKAWRCIAKFDKRLHHRSRQARKWLASLPKNSHQVVELVLDQLNISIADQEEFLRQQLAELPGWAGFCKWSDFTQQSKISLVDFLAVRLAILRAFHEAGITHQSKKCNFLRRVRDPIFFQKMKNREDTYLHALLRKVNSQFSNKDSALCFTDQSDAQLIFCIDVRSESLRFEIECVGNYETFGAAGFFGLPISVKPHDKENPNTACPAIVSPQYQVYEELRGPHAKKHQFLFKLIRKLKSVYQSMKYNFVSPFTLVETLGFWCGISMLGHLITPCLSGKIKKASKRQFKVVEHPLLNEADYPFEARVNHAEAFLTSIGLTKGFSPYVFVCGHTSQTKNNPYASALKCGACSGNGGGHNAQVLVAILNDVDVRNALRKRDLIIPKETQFIACEHETTTDRITYYLNNEAGDKQLQKIQSDLEQASANNRVKRLKHLGSMPKRRSVLAEVMLRSSKWSETRPEWGLAKNASFIIGPRDLTAGIDLEGRSFLHSYDWAQDPEGQVLESILNGPMVVAQWINMQYLFSTLDPIAFGAGNKVTQNVVGKIGVMQGNGSDLMFGLPLQSVFETDRTPDHEVLRLTTIVYAPREKMDRLIAKQQDLRKLFLNQWVRFVVIDPATGSSYELNEDGNWSEFYLD